MEGSEQDRPEPPTPFKLERSRRRGVVARGVDLGFFSSLAAFFAIYWIGGRWMENRIGLAVEQTLIAAPQTTQSQDQLLHVIGSACAAAAAPLAIVAASLFAIVLVCELLQTGFVFSSQPLRIDFGRLNPINGLKRIFSLRMLIETGKTLLKAGLYSVLVWAVAQEALRLYFATAGDARTLAEIARGAALRLLGFAAVAAAGVAIIDQLIARRDFLRKMRMSRRELRRETREREGEPRQKQQRKRLHAEMIKNKKSLKGVRDADMLIVNPTRLAIGLSYDDCEIAPRIVARGRGGFALRLKTLAFHYGITIVEDRDLARSLSRLRLGDFIPEATFGRVAKIYLSLKRKNTAEGEDKTDVQMVG